MKIAGIVILFISLFNTSIIVFAYRDISISLFIMFLITAVGLPLGTYFLTRGSVNLDLSDSEDIKVEGLFSIGTPHQSN
tara:strand:+ start:63 stop:299 length:237 start_codon:yes stop_codon:yes gene_type:complete